MQSQKFFLFSFHCFQIRLPSSCLCYILMLNLYFWRPDFRGQIRGIVPLNKHRRICLTFQILILTSLYCKLYKNYLHCVQEQLFWLEFSKHSRNSSFFDLFYGWLRHVQTCQENRFGELSCFKITWKWGLYRPWPEVFFSLLPSPVFSLLFASFEKKKKPLAPRVQYGPSIARVVQRRPTSDIFP